MDNLVVNAVAPWVGYLQWVGNIREGQGKNGPYAFADFTLKYTNSKMEEKYITFSVSDVEKVEFLKSLETGTPLRVSWFPDSSEFSREGAAETRWYPSLRAYNIGLAKTGERAKEGNQRQAERPRQAYAQIPSVPPRPAPSDYTPAPDETDLPF